MNGPCLCGDLRCPSCGPAQGNSKCQACGRWADDGPCEDPEACGSLSQQIDEAVAQEYAEFDSADGFLDF